MFIYPQLTSNIEGMSRRKSLSDVLNFLIAENGLSQSELARKTNIPQSTINRAVTNKHLSMKVQHLTAIADYFKITVDQLVGKQDLNNGIPKDAIQSLDWDLFFRISRPLEAEAKKIGLDLSVETMGDLIIDLYTKASALGDDASNPVLNTLIKTKLESIQK